MLNRCQNCGGLLHYDIKNACLKCESCDSQFEADKYDDRTEADEQLGNNEIEMNVFTCPNCGGEISTNEKEAVEYCLYCGSFVTLDSQVQTVKRPDYILPFQKTVEDCKAEYKRKLRTRLYAPKEFRDEKFLDGFKGIYIPFWDYEYSYGPKVEFKSVYVTRKGDYVYKQEYDINCDVEGSLDGICYDATSSLDDEISERIVPFDNDKLKPFNSSYMFGFYADTADVSQKVYKKDADEVAQNAMWDDVTSKINLDIEKGLPRKPDDDDFNRKFNVKSKSRLSMLPVWFLTWRNKDRVAYSVMNGDNGDLYAEIPVDIKKFLLISLITAVPIFFLMNILVTVGASDMLMTAVILSTVMLILYSVELDRIIGRLWHIEDKGYLFNDKEAKKRADMRNENLLLILLDMLSGFKVAAVLIVVVGYFILFLFSPFIALIVAVVLPIYALYRIIKASKALADKTVWRDIAGALISLVISLIMLFLDPARDIIYYSMAVLCLLGDALTAIFLLRRYNDLITRPLPHFFDRKAGGDK